MSNQTDLIDILPLLEAIPNREVVSPTASIAVYTRDAEALASWIEPDISTLRRVGISADVLESLPDRVGALREAESQWNAVRYTKDAAQRAYTERSVSGFELLDSLYRHLRFAFRARPDLAARLGEPVWSMNDDEKIQALNDLAVLGRENPEPLAGAGLDTDILLEAAEESDALSRLRGQAVGERIEGKSAKDVRDRAYTFLKKAVDEIRTAGKFLFWRDEARLRGYRSMVKKKKSERADALVIVEAAADEPVAVETVEDPGIDGEQIADEASL